MNRKDINLLLQIRQELKAIGAPGVITAQEANDLCATYGFENNKFARIPRQRRMCAPVNLAQLAAEIVKLDKESKKVVSK